MKHVLAWLGWWLALFWLWLLLAGDWNRIEWVAAACGATVAATVAEVARSRAGIDPRMPLGWLTRARSVPVTIVVDFGIVTWALVRSIARRPIVEGEFRARPVELADGGPGERAWIAWAANFSPNAYVVDLDEDSGLVLVHDLVPNRSSEQPA